MAGGGERTKRTFGPAIESTRARVAMSVPSTPAAQVRALIDAVAERGMTWRPSVAVETMRSGLARARSVEPDARDTRGTHEGRPLTRRTIFD